MKKLILFMLFVFVFGSLQADPVKDLESTMKDFKGWSAEPAESNSMSLFGMKMVNVIREYEKGDSKFLVHVMAGKNPASMAHSQRVEDNKTLKKMKGFYVHIGTENKKEEGVFVVFLDVKHPDNPMMVFSYENIQPNVALTMVKKLSWKQMQKYVRAILK